MASICEHEMTSIYYTTVFPILYSICALSTIYPIYLYIKVVIKGKSDSKTKTNTKILNYLALIFFAANFTTFIFGAINRAYLCQNLQLFLIIHACFAGFYFTQGVMVCIILFMRLIYIFKGSAFEVSKVTMIAFFAGITLNVLLGSVGNIFEIFLYNSQLMEIGAMLVSLAIVIYIFLIISLNGLFIFKLNKVYKLKGNNKKFVDTTTRIFILGCISTTMVALFVTGYVLYIIMYPWSPHVDLIFNLFLIVDVYTNFISIFLSYSHFNGHYKKLCGPLHVQCLKWCTKCIGVDNPDMVEKEIDRANPGRTSLKSKTSSTGTVVTTSSPSTKSVDSTREKTELTESDI